MTCRRWLEIAGDKFDLGGLVYRKVMSSVWDGLVYRKVISSIWGGLVYRNVTSAMPG